MFFRFYEKRVNRLLQPLLTSAQSALGIDAIRAFYTEEKNICAAGSSATRWEEFLFTVSFIRISI